MNPRKRGESPQSRIIRKLHGFSLLELMAVIGIIGIMASIVLVSLSRGKSDEMLKTLAREVANTIRETQNDSVSGLRPLDVSGTVCWFSFEWETQTSANVKVYSSNNSDCSTPPPMQSHPLSNLQLSGGASFTGGSWSYAFHLPHGEVVRSDGSGFGGAMQSIGIQLSGRNIFVCIDPISGSVYETAVGGSCS